MKVGRVLEGGLVPSGRLTRLGGALTQFKSGTSYERRRTIGQKVSMLFHRDSGTELLLGATGLRAAILNLHCFRSFIKSWI